MKKKPKQLEFKRLVIATDNSIAGLKHCYEYEAAFRLQVKVSLFLLPLGLFLADSVVEKVLLISSILIVLLVEVFNTSIERLIDRTGLENHELSKFAKDLGSAVVCFAFIIFFVVWSIILLYKIL